MLTQIVPELLKFAIYGYESIADIFRNRIIHGGATRLRMYDLIRAFLGSGHVETDFCITDSPLDRG